MIRMPIESSIVMCVLALGALASCSRGEVSTPAPTLASNIVAAPETGGAGVADEPAFGQAQRARLEWLSNGPVPAAMTPSAPDDLSNGEGGQ